MTNWYKKIILPWFLNKEMGDEYFEKMRRVVLKDASGVVAELGVGPGYNIPIYENVTKLYAIEPSEELIRIAKTRVGDSKFPIEFIKADAENIPLSDKSVNTVVSTWTLCSVNDLEKVFKEVKRILKPEGKFVFIDHGAAPNPIFHLIQIIGTSITKYFTGNCHYDRLIEEDIKKAGFKIEKIDHPTEKSKILIYNYRGVAVVSK